MVTEGDSVEITKGGQSIFCVIHSREWIGRSRPTVGRVDTILTVGYYYYYYYYLFLFLWHSPATGRRNLACLLDFYRSVHS